MGMSWTAGSPMGTTTPFTTTGRIVAIYGWNMTTANVNYSTLEFLWSPGCTVQYDYSTSAFFPTYTSLSYPYKVIYSNKYVEVTLTVDASFKTLTATVTNFTSSQLTGFNFVIQYVE